jgi:hypothetical protein
VDELARAEAQAGAKAAGVPFVALDVSNEKSPRRLPHC